MKWRLGLEPKPEGFAENSGDDSLRLANAASLKVAVVRGVTVLVTPWRPVFLLLTLQELVNRLANQPRNWNILTKGDLLQFLDLFWLEPYGGKLLPHVKQCITMWYVCQEGHAPRTSNPHERQPFESAVNWR